VRSKLAPMRDAACPPASVTTGTPIHKAACRTGLRQFQPQPGLLRREPQPLPQQRDVLRCK